MEDLKKETCRPYKALCRALKLKYATFKRWKSRLNSDCPVIRLPGPKKVRPLKTGQLTQEIKALNHCRKRTHGAVNLHQSYRQSISRRDFALLVAMARYDAYVEHRNNLRRIHWRVPGLVWSMDGTEWGHDENGKKLHLHNLMDMASRYKFRPIAGEFACGEAIAKHLAWHYDRFGAPLFQKRDNGSNMLHAEVNRMLGAYGVIELNSPPYYPQYNGSMEAAQKEYKSAIRTKLAAQAECPAEHFGAYAEAAVNELNHLPRRSMGRQNACRVYFGRERIRFRRRERRSIYEWILEKTNDIFVKMETQTEKMLQSAYRIAVETWLRLKGFIFVSIGGKVLPNFT